MSKLNKTLKLNDPRLLNFDKSLVYWNKKEKIDKKDFDNFINKTIVGNSLEILKKIPTQSIDLIITDPPYNLTKTYSKGKFNRMTNSKYISWLEQWIPECNRILKNNGSIYICSDWKTSLLIHPVLEKYFIVQNRITWAREKGRASKNNWKNNIEDIFFATKSQSYYFNEANVKIKKKVIAPYVDKNKKAKDWFYENGISYRLTSHSNIFTDLTVPFWSMKENTEHPTQKPEKLIAKLILASSKENDLILDPFVGSGTTSVVSKKLNRNYIGIELEQKFAQITEKRINEANIDKTIQGYTGKYFLDKDVKK